MKQLQTPNKRKRHSYRKQITSQHKKALLTIEKQKVQLEGHQFRCQQLIQKIENCMTFKNIKNLCQQTDKFGFNFTKKSIDRLVHIAQVLYQKYKNILKHLKNQQNSEELQKIFTLIINYFSIDVNYFFFKRVLQFCLKVISENIKVKLNHFALAIFINLCSFQQSNNFLREKNVLNIIKKSKFDIQKNNHGLFKYCLNYLYYCPIIKQDQIRSIVDIIFLFKQNYNYFNFQQSQKIGYLNTRTVFQIELMVLLGKVAIQSLLKLQYLGQFQSIARIILFKIQYLLKDQDKIHYIYLVKFIFRINYRQHHFKNYQNIQLFAKVWKIYQENTSKTHNSEQQIQLSNKIDENIIVLLKIFCHYQNWEVKRPYLQYLYKAFYQRYISHGSDFCQILLEQDIFTVKDINLLEKIITSNIAQDSLIKVLTGKLRKWETEELGQITRDQIRILTNQLSELYQKQKNKNLNFNDEILQELRQLSNRFYSQKKEIYQFEQ